MNPSPKKENAHEVPDNYDLSEKGSIRTDEEATYLAREQERDNLFDNAAAGGEPSTHDGKGESKVSTSLDEESAS
jgi:hypothetical protein